MNLTDKYISNLKHLDKDQFFSQEGTEGLTLRVYKYPSKAKTWFYQYRPRLGPTLSKRSCSNFRNLLLGLF